MKLLEGKKIAEDILKKLGKKTGGKNLKLAAVLVGSGRASLVYLKAKERACKKIGVGFELFNFPSGIKQSELEEEVKKIAKKKDISGLIVQLPLPGGINAQNVLDIVPLAKDVDVLSQKAFAEFKAGTSRAVPPVVAAIDHLLKNYEIDLVGKKVALAGAGRLVGMPMSVWLFQKGIAFSIVDLATLNTKEIFRNADVVISGIGKPGFLQGDMIKEGVVVIDAGTVLQGEKMVGDIDFESVSQKAGFLSPVPGGVGPLTVACLLENLIKLAK